MGHLFIISSSSHFFSETDLEHYLFNYDIFFSFTFENFIAKIAYFDGLKNCYFIREKKLLTVNCKAATLGVCPRSQNPVFA